MIRIILITVVIFSSLVSNVSIAGDNTSILGKPRLFSPDIESVDESVQNMIKNTITYTKINNYILTSINNNVFYKNKVYFSIDVLNSMENNINKNIVDSDIELKLDQRINDLNAEIAIKKKSNNTKGFQAEHRIIHVVKPGESFSNIAKKYNLTVPLLISHNQNFKYKINKLKIGDELLIPQELGK